MFVLYSIGVVLSYHSFGKRSEEGSNCHADMRHSPSTTYPRPPTHPPNESDPGPVTQTPVSVDLCCFSLLFNMSVSVKEHVCGGLTQRMAITGGGRIPLRSQSQAEEGH